MKKTEQGSLMVAAFIVVILLLVGALSFIFWQNFMQSKQNSEVEVKEPTQQTAKVEYQTVASTVKDWTVSLQAPTTWKVEAKDDKYYNYDTQAFEGAKNTTITDPSGKVEITVRHMPFFNADGTCGSSSLAYINKEAMSDSRLSFVEVVSSEQAFMLSATSMAAASAFTPQFSGCLSNRDLINQEGKNVLPPEEPIADRKNPFVSVSISPVFANDDEQRAWNNQKTLDFIKTKEYLEAKSIVKSLKI